MNQIEKWMRYYRPLFQGRFEFFRSADRPKNGPWHQGLSMTNGRFWVRTRGGHDLRRRDADGQSPCAQDRPACDILVGRSDGPNAALTTFPWVEHIAARSYLYTLRAIGAGGVAEQQQTSNLRLTFDDSGNLLGPSPNTVCALAVESVSNGRFRLRWTYDETDEETSPTAFHVFNDDGSSGTINYDVVVATVPYRVRQGYFHWTSTGFAHDVRVTWSVRAASDQGVLSAATFAIDNVARANLPAASAGIQVRGEEGG